ncbi:hypothetical protein [uncultured Tateyamaria sp.]|uniref:hypothetical protein n=1 Tax=uncultured Tateyamaria sp. TaxID=455651 RepID=UPI0026303C92|nr:hypothetical protein [uncultured Tateyamaria sp.]
MLETESQSQPLGTYVQSLLRELDDLPQEGRTSAVLAVTAHLLEYAAFEVAQSDEARQVARLIVLAADMERTALQLQGKPLS